MLMKKKLPAVIVLLLVFSSEAYAKRYITEPLLVPQSPYSGITFYVYRPYNMPKDWYITLDGYPVHKNADGMWVYGTSEGPNLVPTNYVVGSIVPSTAGITKWVSDVQVSELRKFPNAEILEVRQKGFTRSQMAQGKNYSTYIPDWTFNPAFMALGNWKGTVDRIAVISELGTPAAWSGASPRVVYVWTGSSWYQVDTGERRSSMRALRRNYAKLKRFVRESGLKWYAQDMPVLSQQAKAWGYYWLGEISIKN
ncbi:MAG: hypothetical protein IJU07_02815 [Synergistaceae bacterium]|nr:hypothetical protein [Synergistaceae bacterium]